MAYEVICPNGHQVQVQPRHFGKEVGCPICKVRMIVPDLSGSSASESPPPPPPPPTMPTVPTVPTPQPQMTAPSLSPHPQVTPPPPLDEPAQVAAGAGGTRAWQFDLLKLGGYVLLVGGLIAVIFARGCDTLNERYVTRLNGKVTAAQHDLDRKWEDKAISDKKDTKSEYIGNTDYTKDKHDREKGEWLKLERDREDASANNAAWSYWTQLVFMIGSILLTGGLLIVGIRGEGTERIICLGIIGVIAFSLFIYGSPWGVR